MSLLTPFLGETRVLKTKLTAAEIRGRLSASLAKGWFGNSPGACWRGRVQGEQFRLSRLIHHRNSFQAEFEGRVVAAQDGSTELQVRARMSVWVLVFCAMWCCMLGGLGVAVLAAGDLQQAAVPGFMLLFMFALCQFGFHSDVGAGWRNLQDALEAAPL